MNAPVQDEVSREIISLERAALARWCRGDPSGFLELSAPDVVYFDPYVPQRLDGLAALTALYEPLRGKVSADRFELSNPHVQCEGNLAVLTFNFVAFAGDRVFRWNCTEAYRRDHAGWRIIQTHWSVTGPPATPNA